jgi:hypothetical protein
VGGETTRLGLLRAGREWRVSDHTEQRSPTMTKMSTGDDATLGNYRKVAVAVFGEDSKPVKFLDDKIAASPSGVNEEVLADERQMVQVLIQLSERGAG